MSRQACGAVEGLKRLLQASLTSASSCPGAGHAGRQLFHSAPATPLQASRLLAAAAWLQESTRHDNWLVKSCLPAARLLATEAHHSRPVSTIGNFIDGRFLTRQDAVKWLDHAVAAGSKASSDASRRSSAEQASSSQFGSSSSSSQDRDRPEDDERLMVLEAALDHVRPSVSSMTTASVEAQTRDRGWSRAALSAGAASIGLSPAAAGLVSGGEAELVEYFIDKCNAELAARLDGMRDALTYMRMTERVRTGVRVRLEMLLPYLDTWPQALAIQAQPQNAPTALRQLSTAVDTIWTAAGDKSQDYNWYTKRALLAGVYTASELYLLTDRSAGHADTWEALDRRLADVMRLGKAAGNIKKTADAMASNAGAVLSMVLQQVTTPRR